VDEEKKEGKFERMETTDDQHSYYHNLRQFARVEQLSSDLFDCSKITGLFRKSTIDTTGIAGTNDFAQLLRNEK
jgi:hypothetical protein